MSRTRILGLCLPMLALGFCTGCPVPQERGQGKYQYITEPTKQGSYHLYLPVDYVKNEGRHPRGGDRKWPLVMTFHGMKPYDNALPQEREWEKEADTYGYIVCAPKLETCDSFMEYPLTKEHDYVIRDRDRVMAIMDHIFATTRADPRAVLSTSWSCGGYLAHYFVNRFPDRFSCIATRLSNFSPQLLNDANVSRYRSMPVAIFIGDGDFPACKSESEEAVAWYTAKGFSTVRGKMIDNIGHRRIPQTAAAFFAEQLNLQPLHADAAAQTVASLQMVDYQPSVALASAMGAKAVITNEPPAQPASQPPPRVNNASPGSAAGSLPKPTPVINTPPPPKRVEPVKPNPPASVNASDSRSASVDRATSTYAAPGVTPRTPAGNAANNARVAAAPTPKPVSPPADRRSNTRDDTPEPPVRDTQVADGLSRRGPPPPIPSIFNRGDRESDSSRDNSTRSRGNDASRPKPPAPTPATPKSRVATRAKRANINVNGPVGPAPHYLTYNVDLPPQSLEGADFLWMDNGVWMGDEPSGSKVLDSPGLHRISVLVITRNNEEYRGAATVNVLDRAAGRSAAGDSAD